MSNFIQNSIFPKIKLCSQIDLYFRHNEYVDINLNKSIIFLYKYGNIYTDTYFNSLSIGKWKKYTDINSLNFSITFKGKIKITWFVHKLHFSRRIVDEIYLENISISKISLPLSFWNELDDGMLAFSIEAIEESEVHSFNYNTSELSKNKVSMGIVITHFNRQQYVLPAISRLKRELLEFDEFKDLVKLYVVDNSQNLLKVENVTIIPNENLGGSGGFTRGLVELKEEGAFTHCLFMDDDASCEVEGIKRTLALLQYAKDPELAVGGAMLREAEMFRQFENGARFEGICKPNKCGLDLRDIHSLLVNEIEERIDYAGWWFFAFPLSKVKHLAFPYFVRGDDIGFGLVHKFNIITLNGISSWQDDFALKNGPLPYYLDTRNHIMQNFHGLMKDSGLGSMLKTTARMALRNLLTYHYETALASIMAIEDATKGSDFWRNNVDMASKRKEIGSMIVDEKPTVISLDVLGTAYPGNPNERLLTRLFRWLTLNGHLLPTIFFKKGMVWQNKGFGGNLREVYRYKEVLYIHHPTHTGFVLKHSKRKFFSHLFRYFKAIYKLTVNYKSLKEDYTKSYDDLTSQAFWGKQFHKDN